MSDTAWMVVHGDSHPALLRAREQAFAECAVGHRAIRLQGRVDGSRDVERVASRSIALGREYGVWTTLAAVIGVAVWARVLVWRQGK